MKRITTILLAMTMIVLTQCKPEPVDENNNSNEKKVKISCTIPLNNGGKSDFHNLMNGGVVNWSDGREYIYLMATGETPQIIRLESWADGNPSTLEFYGEAAEGLLTSGTSYEIWYFGNSHKLESAYYSYSDSRIEGSIGVQSGKLEDLGCCHIASTTVTAENVNGAVVLNLNGTLSNKMAILLLDLENVSELKGSAINCTDYFMEYNDESQMFELSVVTNDNASIETEGIEGISYLMLFPNETDNCNIQCEKSGTPYEHVFHNGVRANKVYFRTGVDGSSVEALSWNEVEIVNKINGYEFVDLGLPSGLKWAKYNIGANSPEEYGNYYSWGEVEVEADNNYSAANNSTYQIQYGDITGNPEHDAATANWGSPWKMPNEAEYQELMDNCEWTWTSQNNINGYKVTGPNGNSIFLPASGYRINTLIKLRGTYGYYWLPTPYDNDADNTARSFRFYNIKREFYYYDYRYYGKTIRPVASVQE